MIPEITYKLSFEEGLVSRFLTLSIWEYDSSISELDNLLSDEEKIIYKELKVKSRRNEFVAGRVLAKRTVESSLNLESHINLSITNGVWGFPVINTKEYSDMWISIAHTKKHAAVLLSLLKTHPVGVDIEEILEINEESLTKYLSKYGLNNSLEMMHVIWVAKEAVSKTILTGFTIADELFEIEQIITKNERYTILFKHFPQIKVTSFVEDDLAIGVAYPEIWKNPLIKKIK